MRILKTVYIQTIDVDFDNDDNDGYGYDGRTTKRRQKKYERTKSELHEIKFMKLNFLT